MDRQRAQIEHYPAVVLGGQSRPVEKIDDSVRRLVERMTEVMVANRGVGLAAVQIGVPLRVFIVSLDSTAENVRVYINPTVSCSGGLDAVDEGCLSVPGINSKVRRFKRCTISATGLDGKRFSLEAEGLLARVFQHELDHLEGLTIVDRMPEASRIAHRRRLKKLRSAGE
jgi:peptide deformylase